MLLPAKFWDFTRPDSHIQNFSYPAQSPNFRTSSFLSFRSYLVCSIRFQNLNPWPPNRFLYHSHALCLSHLLLSFVKLSHLLAAPLKVDISLHNFVMTSSVSPWPPNYKVLAFSPSREAEKGSMASADPSRGPAEGGRCFSEGDLPLTELISKPAMNGCSTSFCKT
jgi:hypothetical protein